MILVLVLMQRKKRKKMETEKRSSQSSSVNKSYLEVSGICCSSEIPLIERILKPLEGVLEVTVIVPSRTVIVLHHSLLINQLQMGE